jgi:hypothetical protein
MIFKIGMDAANWIASDDFKRLRRSNLRAKKTEEERHAASAGA